MLQANNATVPAREVLEALALKFSTSPERSGKFVAQMKQAQRLLESDIFAYLHCGTLTCSPLLSAFDRIIQSPVSFGGFGSLTRHLGRLRNDERGKERYKEKGAEVIEDDIDTYDNSSKDESKMNSNNDVKVIVDGDMEKKEDENCSESVNVEYKSHLQLVDEDFDFDKISGYEENGGETNLKMWPIFICMDQVDTMFIQKHIKIKFRECEISGMLAAIIKDLKFSLGDQVRILNASLTIIKRDKVGIQILYGRGKVEALGLVELVLDEVAIVEEWALDNDVKWFGGLKAVYLGDEHFRGYNLSTRTDAKLGVPCDLSETYAELVFHDYGSGIFPLMGNKYNISSLVMTQKMDFFHNHHH
ncbi:hypothetical protein POM88_014161 [Heracleum sosnowskyi]|uniref:Uncharacterized protein n=1 Tax=Heracleum sosnowskyi TaxID=360622 RepID=A0AAD8IZW2_9APIA|nr:hypothetical protein POM88_014161 [Heracleum sosnowskyi]